MTRAIPPSVDIAVLARQLEAAPGIGRLHDCSESFAATSPDTVQAILSEAARFATARLDELNASGECDRPIIVENRVKMAAMHRSVWNEFAEAGWITLDLPGAYGGQGLPLVLAVAVQEIFDRSCPAFGMLPVSIRSAARLIATYADEVVRSEWLPKLASGEWGATICISEVDAGSDVGRIRTVAEPQDDGSWSINGEKQWISFGDHDLTSRIGHCLLARTPTSERPSLFLVPDRICGRDNNVAVRRIEEKLGLHLSPTCALGFDGARGILLGEEGRGLAQMFVMITNMRMAVGAMGLGIASGAADTALRYAEDRKQGGTGPSPVAIAEHPDVQRQLLHMCAQVELLRGLLYAAAVHADLARCDGDSARADEAAALAQWLLPIVKTLGGEIAFDASSGAIQVLGGAGYTCDWPVQQSLRDARVLPIFEGTTGMQALDLLHRRLWRDNGRGLATFCRIARKDVALLDDPRAGEAETALRCVEDVAARFLGLKDRPKEAEAGATAFLGLAGLAAMGWIAARLTSLASDDPATGRLRALGGFWLEGLGARATAAAKAATIGAKPLAAFAALRVVQ